MTIDLQLKESTREIAAYQTGLDTLASNLARWAATAGKQRTRALSEGEGSTADRFGEDSREAGDWLSDLRDTETTFANAVRIFGDQVAAVGGQLDGIALEDGDWRLAVVQTAPSGEAMVAVALLDTRAGVFVLSPEPDATLLAPTTTAEVWLRISSIVVPAEAS